MLYHNESTLKSVRRRSAFTLVEILVALGIMMLLFVIILIPVNMGLDMFHIGKARSEVTQANQLVLGQLASELKQAIYVFPNEEMPGITNKSPYTSNDQKPFYDATITVVADREVSNTARIDFLLPATSNGSVTTPLQPTNYLVTYYARRLDINKAYDVFSNPVVLWRAQYPYKNDTLSSSNTANLVDLPTRYNSSPPGVWLRQAKGEPDLSPQSDISNAAVAAATHTALMPNDMALVASSAAAATPSYQPDSSFTCDDSDNDGKIDRVTMSLLMAKYDSIGAQSRSQQIRLSRTVDLPNVK